jgi:hypothetical protein
LSITVLNFKNSFIANDIHSRLDAEFFTLLSRFFSTCEFLDLAFEGGSELCTQRSSVFSDDDADAASIVG